MAAAIKICGISTPETLDAVLDAQADHVGFNFFPPSPRHLGLVEASALAARAASRISKVGVFVDPDDAALRDAISAAKLDAVQLHGDESPARSAAVEVDRLADEIVVVEADALPIAVDRA